jgi:Cu(I)/Ag(I) efflux system membrane fusion protein
MNMNGNVKQSGRRVRRFYRSAGTVLLVLSLFLISRALGAEEMNHSQGHAKEDHTQHAAPPSHEEKQEDHSQHIDSPSHTEEQGAHGDHGSGHGEPSESVQPDHSKHPVDMTVKLTPEMLKRTDIRTAPVDYRTLVKEIRTVGEIAYDERRVKVVSAWIGGRINRLHVNFTGVEVKKGAPLAELYSPELISTQQEYLLALETRDKMEAGGNAQALKSAVDLVNATKQRLVFWGISQEEIAEMEKSCQVVCSETTINAPIGGTVIHKQASEGQYVKTGDQLFTIADLSVVWAMADVYEYEMAWVKPGQKVAITSTAYPEDTFTGTVSFIDPFLNKKTRSVKVRMDVPNTELMLKPGMFVDARLKIPHEDHKPVLAIPHTAVLDTGARKLAYVDLGEGTFKPVEIKVGSRAGDWVPVVSGLEKGQRVAVSATYLLDSQRTLGGAASGEFGGAIGHSH